jgi:hypothetical protein
MKQHQQPMQQQQQQQQDIGNRKQHNMRVMQDHRHPGFAHDNGSDLSSDILNQAANLLCALQLMGGGAGAGQTQMDMAKQNAIELLRKAGSDSLPHHGMGNSNLFGGLLQTQATWQYSNNFGGAANDFNHAVGWQGAEIQSAPSNNMPYQSLRKSKSAPAPPRHDSGCRMDFLDSLLPDIITAPQHDATGGLPFYNLPQPPFSYLTSQ